MACDLVSDILAQSGMGDSTWNVCFNRAQVSKPWASRSAHGTRRRNVSSMQFPLDHAVSPQALKGTEHAFPPAEAKDRSLGINAGDSTSWLTGVFAVNCRESDVIPAAKLLF